MHLSLGLHLCVCSDLHVHGNGVIILCYCTAIPLVRDLSLDTAAAALFNRNAEAPRWPVTAMVETGAHPFVAMGLHPLFGIGVSSLICASNDS